MGWAGDMKEEVKSGIKFGRVFALPEFDDEKEISSILQPMPNEKEYFLIYRPTCDSFKDKTLNRLFGEPLLTKEQQFHLFRRYNYLKYAREKISKIIKDRNLLVASNMRLMMPTLKKHFINYDQLFSSDLFDEFVMTLIRCVDAFDFRMNICFSTYVVNGIRYAERNIFTRRKTKLETVSIHGELEEALPGDIGVTLIEGTTEEQKISNAFASVTKREREVVTLYYGLNARGSTLQEIGDKFKLSKEAIRLIRNKALEKMRKKLSSSPTESLV